jgi:glucan biosynthesis protein C
VTHAAHERLHHLDALRAFAMLLGVALHAAMSFTQIGWPVEDAEAGGGAIVAVTAIHGFRMQLFFLLSGYFSMALLRHRGVRGFVRNRVQRIALPLALSCATVLPVTWIAIAWASDGRSPGDILERIAGLPTVIRWMVFPLLSHLWFLWFLCWMAPALVAAVAVARRMPRLRPPHALVRTPLCLLWLVPLTAALSAPMGMWGSMPSFGADTSAGIVPMPHVLLYYGLFFGFGALAATVPGAITGISRGWWAWLAVAAAVFLPALVLCSLAPEAERLVAAPGARRIAALAGSALFTWSATLGLLGAFAAFLRHERPWVRWLADSSYWMYLAHLAPVLVLQALLADAPLGAWAKFATILGATVGVLLLAYAVAVRRTWVGRMLNGPRPVTSPSS